MANKTQPTKVNPQDFFQNVTPEGKRQDTLQLARIFQDATGWKPVMWGPSIIGYGQYHYKYATGREGDFLATGFSPRKANFSVYIMPGYQDFSSILDRIGKHKTGASCLYFNKLADIDTEVLKELIKVGLNKLEEIYPVQPS